jgi:cell division protein FtsB
MASKRPSPFKRLVIGMLVLFAVLFAIEGGEFGTSDLVRQRSAKAHLTREIDSLQRIVDSLGRFRKALETDPAVQERIAREVFGMVRGDKEIVYRFTDSTAKPSR